MIQIIESICAGPIRFLPDKKAKLVPGLVAQIVEIDGVPSCTVSDGTRPFGVIGAIDGPHGLVSIWFDSMILRTSKYERRETYDPGNPLYVSKKGKFTTKKPMENSHLVGHVIMGPDDQRNYVELSWV